MNPDISNIETSDWIAGGGALLLFISLFLPWVRVSVSGGGIGVTGTSGASFAWISMISVLAVLGIFVATLLNVDLPFPSGLVYLGAGALSVLFTLLVILIRPIGTGGFSVSGISKIPWYGAFIGLVAGAGVLVGGFMKWQAER